MGWASAYPMILAIAYLLLFICFTSRIPKVQYYTKQQYIQYTIFKRFVKATLIYEMFQKLFIEQVHTWTYPLSVLRVADVSASKMANNLTNIIGVLFF